LLFGAPYRVVALDGQDVTAPGELGPLRLMLGMGRRADVVFTCGSGRPVRLAAGQVAGRRRLLEPFFRPGPARAGDDRRRPRPGDVRHVAARAVRPEKYGQPAPDPVTQSGRFDVTFPVELSENPGITTRASS